jgi:acyl carrier protein
VGLAAVQIARNIGAEIFATAGFPEKREHLRNLGIEHVFDSRSLSFADEIRQCTGGEGVDVVLNSLAGDFITASLDLLRSNGRFIEIGKRDIFADTRIGLYPFRKNITYSAFDLGQMISGQAADVHRQFDRLMQLFTWGDLEPLPTSVIPVGMVVSGFKRMMRAEHIGKIVFKLNDDPDSWRSRAKQFNQDYTKGVSVAAGRQVFTRLLACDVSPPYVLALGRTLEDFGSVSKSPLTVGTDHKNRESLSCAYREARTETEKSLVQVWEKVLGVNPIGIEDNFFELGGDSISAIQIQFGVSKAFDVRLTPAIFYEHPNIAGQARVIESAARD